MFLGFDGGGTKVAARAEDASGAVLFEGRGGPANWASTPRGELLHHLEDAARGAPKADHVAVCLAGLLTEQDAGEVARALHDRFPGARITAFPDYVAAWAAYDGPGDPILVLSGTGSIVVSATENGCVLKSGGRGPLLGDEGSMVDLGREAIKTVGEGRPDEGWRRAVMGDADRLDEWIAEIYRSSSVPSRVAEIGSLALRAGGPESEAIVRVVADRLAETVWTHLRSRVEWSQLAHRRTPWRVKRGSAPVGPPALVLVGGLWEASPRYEDEFRIAMRLRIDREHRIAEGCIIDRLRHPPVLGAVRLARQWSL